MRKKTILLQLSLSYLLIILLSIGSVTWYAVRAFRKYDFERTRDDLTARARLVEKNLPSPLNPDFSDVDELCKDLGRASTTRITIILPSGKVVGDSETQPAQMDNHADRPEVAEALAGGAGMSTRYSSTLKQEMMYVAVPLMHEGRVAAAVRTATPLLDIERKLFRLSNEIVFGSLVVAAAAAVIGLVVSRRIARPLAELKEGADRFSKGDLQHRVAVSELSEVGALADAMNKMAEELDRKIKEAVQQRNEQEAVLSSMTEGVMAIGSDEHILNLNQAACRLLGIHQESARGRSIQETVRNSELQRFVRRALQMESPVETDFVLVYDDSRKHIHALGTPLRNAGGGCIGAVLVLNDVTSLRQLENIRREFVANVSHELRTPITSIKGFVETLLNGAIDNPDDARRFLSIIAKQAGRLNSLLEDLLALARIDQEAEREQVALAPANLCEVIESAIRECEPKLLEKSIVVAANCPEDLQARINPPLLEQALINLLDNAIKYSDKGKTVSIEAKASESEIIISVRDEGCGIEKEHLPRLFERFYRVDKARSRKLGGTGLGLAIVKHIVQAHGGSVSVESTPGKGSTFSIHLPNPTA